MTALAEEEAEPWFTPQPNRLILAALYGLAAVAAVVAMAYLFQPVPTTTAVVEGSAGDGLTELRLLDVAGPGRSVVDWSDLDGAAPGDTLTVGVGGACQCEPFQVQDSRGLAAMFAGIPLLFVVQAVRSVRRDRLRRHQRRAGESDRAELRPVSVRPQFSRMVRKSAGAWLSVTDRTSGEHLGWLQMEQITPHFTPGRLAWMTGADDPNGCVALQDESRTHTVLPVSPLRATAPDPTDWSDLAVQLLRWGGGPMVGAAESVERLPSVGRVSMSTANTTPGSWSVARHARERTERVLAPWRLRLGYVLSFGVGVGFVLHWGLLAYLPFLGALVAVIWVRTSLSRPVRKAIAAGSPEMIRYSPILAEVLITLVPPAMATELAASPGNPSLPAVPVDRRGQTRF